MSQALEPVELSFKVACSPEHAFRVWTADIASWWPADHSVSGEAGLAGSARGPGRWPDLRAHRGRRRARVGRGDGAGNRPSASPTSGTCVATAPTRPQVEIRFTPAGDGATRVDIEHTGWERLGSDGPTWRDRNLGGWQTLLPHYLEHLERTDQEA